MTRRLRVHLLPETEDMARPNACAVLRLLDPYTCAAVTDVAEISVSQGLPDDHVDVLVMQRMANELGDPVVVESLLRRVRARGIKLVYDIDDNLLDRHPVPKVEAGVGRHRRAVRSLLRAADHVTVSTPLLRDRVQGLCQAVTVLPNMLEDRRIGPVLDRPPGPRLHIGYFGTFTHLRDLMAVVGPIRAALSQLSERPLLSLCGISDDPRLPDLFADMADVTLVPPTGDYESFLRLIRTLDWDIGLAPLAGGAFEAAKSDIKFLEHGAFGIAGLYAAHPAYAAVQDGVTGLVAAPDGWTAALLRLAGDTGLRRRIVQSAGRFVRQERMLARRGADWARMLQAVAGSETASGLPLGH
jgi:hypothetical protein